jgi:hypothetical protein
MSSSHPYSSHSWYALHNRKGALIKGSLMLTAVCVGGCVVTQEQYNSGDVSSVDQLSRVKSQIESVKTIMVENIGTSILQTHIRQQP